MKVKVFDESHEKDLEQSVNMFLSTIDELVDIKGEEQIYWFTAMIIYKDLSE